MNDDTWYGEFIPRLAPEDGSAAGQIADYLRFSKEWNERLRQNLPAAPAEFKRFGPIVESGLWSARSKERLFRIAEAPVFFINGDVSWRAIDTLGETN